MTQAVTPYLYYEDAEAAIAFLVAAFGFREVERTTGSAGGVHAELEASPRGGRVYLGQPRGDFKNPREVGATSQVYVLVETVDAHLERAKGAGAGVTAEPTTTPLGFRQYECVDPQGHEWVFAEPVGA